MKLKCNLTTEDTTAGKVYKNVAVTTEDNRIKVIYHGDSGGLITEYYDSFDDAAEMWGKAPEEPKEHWYIRYDGGINTTCYEADDGMKSIGNDFETKEEAEKAVEKLKAWQRMKDNGFRFVKYDTEHCGISTIYFIYDNKIDMKDLGLLFGGEE